MGGNKEQPAGRKGQPCCQGTVSLATKGYSSLPKEGIPRNQEQLGYWGDTSMAPEGQQVVAISLPSSNRERFAIPRGDKH